MRRVLIVDDNAQNRYLLRSLLQGNGFTVEEAGHGAEALAKARQTPPDVAISDLLMPVMDGYTLLRHWRTDNQLKAVPFVVYTATYTDPKDERLALRLGADAFLIKPAEPEPIMACIQKVLERINGLGEPTGVPLTDQEHLLSEYSETLVRKLEKRARQLEQANRILLNEITEHKRTATALRENEARLAEAVRLARMGYWNRDLVSGQIDWSDMLHEIFGVAASESGQSWETFLQLVHPDDRTEVERRVAAAVETAGTLDHTYRVCAQGVVRIIHEVGRAVAGDDGRPVRLVGTARDVTEMTRATEMLRLRDRAIQAVSQGIFITDPNQIDNPIIFASPGFERMTGYPAAEVLGRNLRFLHGKGTDPEMVATLQTALASGQGCSVEILNYRKDGKPFWNQLSLSPVLEPGGRLTHFVGVQTDVTERHLLEEQLRHSQKMEAIGQLAGGVAHDFNNLLTVITGFSEILQSTLPSQDPRRESVQAISEAAERAASLTRQMLAFSRRTVLAPRVLDLNNVVRDTDKLLRRLIGEDVLLTTVLDPGLNPVKVDSGHLGQVLMNLAINARDAMPRGGKLTIETANTILDESYCATHAAVQPGEYVMLAVSDTGCGIPPQIMPRIFEPFFTTKGVGKGTGLGLAVVHGIIKQSGGDIRVYSEPGLGTTFKIYLPAVRETPLPHRVPNVDKAPSGTETLLLVEDEASVRGLTVLALQMNGYTVLAASNAQDAQLLAEKHGPEIALLITDVIMPGMGGAQLATLLQQRFPGLRVLFLSGYTDDAIVRHGILHEKVAFLQKPYSPQALARKVRDLLDEGKREYSPNQ